MAFYKVRGGKELKGEIQTASGKNSPIAIICGSLLIKGKTRLKKVAKVEEIDRLLELLGSIGVKFEWEDETTLVIDASGDLTMDTIDKEACGRMRISLLLMGALAAREQKFTLFKESGCNLGKRTIKPHVLALKDLGVEVNSTEIGYEVDASKLKANKVVMYESGDTATENAIIAATLAPGTTEILFASANYMVQDLCRFLSSAGAKIEGIGTTTLKITGVSALSDVEEYFIMPDPVDAMAWISLGVTTKSHLVVKNCPLDFLELELKKLEVMGQKYNLLDERMSDSGHFRIADIELLPSELVALEDKITCRPFPGLNIDALPLFAPILTQAKGQTLMHDWTYENRALYLLELQKFGASVILMDPHRVLFQGPRELKGNEVVAPYAIRPAMSVLICMIAAKGESTLRNIYPIERAYEKLVSRLKSIGVDIERFED